MSANRIEHVAGDFPAADGPAHADFGIPKNTGSGSRDLRRAMAWARRWGWFVLLCATLAAGGGWLAAKVQRPTYQATTAMLVDQQVLGQDSYTSLLTSSQVVPVYVQLVSQPAVLDQAARQVGGISATQLQKNLNVTQVADVQVIQIQVTDASPGRAAALANAVAAAFIASQQQSAQADMAANEQELTRQLNQADARVNALTQQIASVRAIDPLSGQLQPLQQQLDDALAQRDAIQTTGSQLAAQAAAAANGIHIVQPALVPSVPYAPKPLLYWLAGGALGLIVGVALALLLETLDDRVRTAGVAEQLTGVPVLGSVGRAGSRMSFPLLGRRRVDVEPAALLPTTSDARLEATWSIVAANLSNVSRERKRLTLLITSPSREDGRTTTAINLAVTLAQGGSQVLLVDADLRQPRIHALLGLPNDTGLSTYLRECGEQSYEQAQQYFTAVPDVAGLRALTAGPRSMDIAHAQVFGRLQSLIQLLRLRSRNAKAVDSTDEVEVVVIDAPPVLPFADSRALARDADGTLLVLDATRTTVHQCEAAKTALKRAHARLQGIVLNRGAWDDLGQANAGTAWTKAVRGRRSAAFQAQLDDWPVKQNTQVVHGGAALNGGTREQTLP